MEPSNNEVLMNHKTHASSAATLRTLLQSGMRLLRSDEPIAKGLTVVNLADEADSDENGDDRTTPAGSIGTIVGLNHGTTWDLTFASTGGWICPTEAELRHPDQYLLYVRE